MRFPLNSRLISCAFRPATQAIVLTVLIGLSGCEGYTPNSFNPNQSFLDASEVAVKPTKGPLLVPILDKLNTGIDEPSDEFANATDITDEDTKVIASDYTIGKSDLIQVTIQDLQAIGAETVKQARVSESGNISLPLIGQVGALGYTEAQLEQIIAAKYQDAGFLKNATVSVTVLEARARTFSILGAVQQAGQYAIPKSDFHLLDALVLARDITVDTDRRGNRGIDFIYVIRSATPAEPGAENPTSAPATAPVDILAPKAAAPAPDLAPAGETAAAPAAGTTAPSSGKEADGRYVIVDGKPQWVLGPAPAPEAAPTTQPFSFNELKEPMDKRIIRVPIGALKQGDLRYNIVVRPDDLILVRPPVQGEYYMGGHIARTGVYSLSARKISLRQALWSAGGLDQLGVPGRTMITRRVENNKEIIARVDLEKIMAGEEPDLYLKPDDVVEVGTNAVAPFLAAIRGGFRMTYGFGFLYDKNYGQNNNNNGN